MTATAKTNGGSTKTRKPTPALMRATLGRLTREMNAHMDKGNKLAEEITKLNKEFIAWSEERAAAKSGGGKANGGKGGAPPG